MIVIHIRLATLSLFSIGSALLSAAVAALGLVLGLAHYDRPVQIPSCLTAAAAIVVAVVQLGGVPWSYRVPLLAVNAVLVLLLAGSGLYYLGERVTVHPPNYLGSLGAPYHRVELAFIVLWLVSLLAFTSITAYAVGAVSTEQAAGLTTEPESPELWQKPQPQPSYPDLGAPLDIPTVGTNMPHLSPRLSWPSTVGSAHGSLSFNSLGSALDVGAGAHDPVPGTNDVYESQSHPQEPPSPAKRLKMRLMRSSSTTDSAAPPKSPKKSPLKLNKSTFSLKREPSRRTQASPSSASFPIIPGSVPGIVPGSVPNMAPGVLTGSGSGSGVIPGLPGVGMHPRSGTLPHSFQSSLESPFPSKNYVIIPNENGTDSRSVSGSSQVTGTVFPAAEYNRKINAAGFQKDEPRPLRLDTPRAGHDLFRN